MESSQAGLSEDFCSIYRCRFCSFQSFNKLLFVKHIFQAHNNEESFSYACGFSNCSRIFTTGASFDAFRSHFSRYHDGRIEHCMPTVLTGLVGDRDSEVEFHSVTTDAEENMDTDSVYPNSAEEFVHLESESDNDNERDVQLAAAHFILILKEKFKLTQTSLDYAIKGIEDITMLSANRMKCSVMSLLNKSGSSINAELEAELHDYLNPPSPFASLKTEYQQNRFFKENFGLIEPETILLGTSFKYQQSGSTRRLVEFKETFQYVPLLPNLEMLLNSPDVLEEVTRSHMRSDGLLGDYCDGSLFKEHQLFSMSDPSNKLLTLQFILYYDDVEVTDPLSSGKGKHKLALFYYTLGNIQPKYRASLKTIQLIAVVTYPRLKEYGFESVLKPFVNDMNTLAEGCKMILNGREVIVKGAVLTMLGDTQASHAIGGFKVGVGFSLRKCRNCLATQETMNTLFKEEMFVLRTPSNYDYHCSLLSGPLHVVDSVTYGINYQSVLNNLKYFHVCDNQLPQDIMHLLLEGVIPHTLKAMLHSFVRDKCYFTIDSINARILSFNFSRSESKNKPCSLSAKILNNEGSINQTASQMWNLAVYLPLMIADDIPEDDREWECFLLLLNILQICVSKVISKDLVEYLKVLIELYLSAFRECYPHINIIPKQHYMVHLPNQILRLGPLVSSWCMRMEAKNRYFKSITRQGNFKNISYSVAKRHQRLACAILSDRDFFEKSIITSTVQRDDQTFLSSESDWMQEYFINHLQAANISSIMITRPVWIEWQGSRFYSGEFIWCGYQDDLPQFGKICDILIIEKQVFLRVNIYTTLGIDQHHNSFVIKASETSRLEPVTYDSKFLSILHSLQPHTLQSSLPGTVHLVTKCFALKM